MMSPCDYVNKLVNQLFETVGKKKKQISDSPFAWGSATTGNIVKNLTFLPQTLTPNVIIY